MIRNLDTDNAGRGNDWRSTAGEMVISFSTRTCQTVKRFTPNAVTCRSGRPEVGAALPDEGGRRDYTSPSRRRRRRRRSLPASQPGGTSHEPWPSCRVQSLPQHFRSGQNPAVQGAAAGPARTCHQRKIPARSSPRALHNPPATEPPQPFSLTRCPLSGARS